MKCSDNIRKIYTLRVAHLRIYGLETYDTTIFLNYIYSLYGFKQ